MRPFRRTFWSSTVFLPGVVCFKNYFKAKFGNFATDEVYSWWPNWKGLELRIHRWSLVTAETTSLQRPSSVHEIPFKSAVNSQTLHLESFVCDHLPSSTIQPLIKIYNPSRLPPISLYDYLHESLFLMHQFSRTEYGIPCINDHFCSGSRWWSLTRDQIVMLLQTIITVKNLIWQTTLSFNNNSSPSPFVPEVTPNSL